VIDGALLVETLTAGDWTRVRKLVDQYRDFPLGGGTDASLIAIAERFKTTRIPTLNRPHFGAGASEPRSRVRHPSAPVGTAAGQVHVAAVYALAGRALLGQRRDRPDPTADIAFMNPGRHDR
jgi:hypothetical protein